MLLRLALRSRIPVLGSLTLGVGGLTASTIALAEKRDSQGKETDEDDEVVFGVTSYPANDPIEDRADVQRLDVLGGWWFACFDERTA